MGSPEIPGYLNVAEVSQIWTCFLGLLFHGVATTHPGVPLAQQGENVMPPTQTHPIHVKICAVLVDVVLQNIIWKERHNAIVSSSSAVRYIVQIALKEELTMHAHPNNYFSLS